MPLVEQVLKAVLPIPFVSGFRAGQAIVFYALFFSPFVFELAVLPYVASNFAYFDSGL